MRATLLPPALAVAILAVVAAQAAAPRVALIYSDHGNFRHRDDYDGRLADMGWPQTKFENTQLADLVGRLGDLDVVLGSALFNYTNVQDFGAHREALLAFVREGGGVVLTDCNYPQMVTWLGALGDGWEASVANTQAATSPMGWIDAEHPLYTTPNRIETIGGTWAQMQLGDAWTVLARSEEGGVTAAFRREGRGFLYITSKWPLDEPLLANVWQCLQLSRAGIEAALPDLAALTLGRNAFSLQARNLTEGPLRIGFEVRDERAPGASPEVVKGSADVGAAQRAQVTAAIENAGRGEHRLSALLNVDGRTVLATDPVTVTIPPLLQVTVVRPTYRAAIYAAHPPREVEVEALVTPDAGDDIAGMSLVARLGEGGTPITTELRGPAARIVLPLGGAPKADVEVSVGLRQAGRRLASETVTIPLVPTTPDQVSIDESCATWVDGAPFFPIGIYHVPLDDFGKLPAMGFNSVVAWGTTLDGARQGLDAARAADLKVVLELSAFLRGEYSPTGLSEVIDGVKDHPALLTWYSVDEPAGKQLDWCRDAVRLIARGDENHPVYLVSCNPGEFAQYVPTTEILAIDPYPIPHAPVEMVAGWMKVARQAVDGRRPIWLIPQCQNTVAYSNPQEGRGPTPDEERCMVYQGLIYGAKAIVYYPWDDGPCGLIHDPALMDAVTRINGELAQLGPELLTCEHRLIAEGSEPPGLQAASFIGDKYVYILATNTSNEAITASLPLPKSAGDAVEVLFEERTVQTKGGVLTDTLAPLAVHVYRMDTR